jgi:hypothetical protein
MCHTISFDTLVKLSTSFEHANFIHWALELRALNLMDEPLLPFHEQKVEKSYFHILSSLNKLGIELFPTTVLAVIVWNHLFVDQHV